MDFGGLDKVELLMVNRGLEYIQQSMHIHPSYWSRAEKEAVDYLLATTQALIDE